ncbi:MAG: S9 family peptidase, partial [Bacteroidota bacterium]
DGENIGFVRANNLFVMDIASGKEAQLTFDGSDNILNGKFDWVYEEEFSIIDGWQWSPDSKRIAFWRLDQSAVPAFPLVRYSEKDAHAEVETMRYPKAGDPNSLVQIGVVSVEDKKMLWLNLGTNPDIYIPRIQWTNDPNILSVQRLNRGQDTLEVMLANVSNGSMKTILTETDSAWLEIESDDLTFLKKSKQFVWTSFRDGYTHIYLYSLDGKLERQVTKGEWDVTEVVGVDEDRRLVYFVAARESPLDRHLYSIQFDGTGMKRLTQEAGWHSARLSPDKKTFIDTYSGAVRPTQIWLKKTDGSLVAPLVENRLDSWNGLPVTQHSFFTFKTPDGLELNGYMLKPADFDPTKKYPVLMFVYGAGGQTVTNRWGGRNYLWYQLLAQHGYIVASVDPRGTDARGKKFRQITNRQLGVPNTQDLIEAAKYLGSLSYIDASRIGIWGWSGGGYHTLMAMTYGADYFKTGIAVAAVTNFKFYDTIWTERYMDTPQSNPEGYKNTSPITYASKLKGNLLIVHGTTDDNVHWQNSIAFIDELIRNNKQFETMFYPGRAHGISDAAAQKHLFTKMTSFILEKL